MEIKEDKTKILQIIEASRKTGKIKKGINEVTKTIETGAAKFVVIADDTDPKEVIMHIPALCDEKQIPFVRVPSRDELGNVAGLGVKTTGISIIDFGEGEKLFQGIQKKE